MKPTSVIFLIVSVLLACVGLLLCFTATSIAANDGTAIFSQTGSAETGYNYTTTFALDESKTATISFDLADVDVYVYPTNEQSRIELVNFPEGSYRYHETKTGVKLTDGASFKNMLDLENLEINFNGFRDYLHWYRYRNNRKSVNLYIGAPEHLTKISIASSGNITVDGRRTGQNTYLELNDIDVEFTSRGGDINVSAFRSTSMLKLEATDEAFINLDSVYVNNLEIYGVNSFVDMNYVSADYSFFVEINQGNVEFAPGSFNLSAYDLIFSAKDGTVKYGQQLIKNGAYEKANYTEAHSDPSESGEEDRESETDEAGNAEETEAPVTYKPTPNSVIIIVKKGDITVK